MNDLSRVRPLIVDLGCCAEIARRVLLQWPLSAHCFELRPDEANTLIVAGRVTAALAPVLCDLYAQLAAPRRVIALGTCAGHGEPWATLPLVEVIPVDIALPGCPPSPQALRNALACSIRRRRI